MLPCIRTVGESLARRNVPSIVAVDMCVGVIHVAVLVSDGFNINGVGVVVIVIMTDDEFINVCTGPSSGSSSGLTLKQDALPSAPSTVVVTSTLSFSPVTTIVAENVPSARVVVVAVMAVRLVPLSDGVRTIVAGSPSVGGVTYPVTRKVSVPSPSSS